MKALSVHPAYAIWIADGKKTVEWRSWKTSYRGEILICSTAKKLKNTIPGYALCTVRLVDVVPFTRKHLKAACMDEMPYPSGYAWILSEPYYIRPIPLKGKLSLWNYDGEVEYLPAVDTEEEEEQVFHEIWEPLII